MKYDTSTLLLASTVRELAKELYQMEKANATANEIAKCRAAEGGTAEEWDEAFREKREAEAEWAKHHPFFHFLLPALNELERVADVITRSTE